MAVTATARSHRPAQMSLAGCLPSLASEASAKAAAVVVSAAISAAAVSAAAAKVATAARPTASGGQPLAAAVLLPGTAAGLLPAKLACAGTVILWRWPPPPPRGNSAGPRRGSFVAVNLRRGSQPGQPWPCRCADGAAVCVLQASKGATGRAAGPGIVAVVCTAVVGAVSVSSQCTALALFFRLGSGFGLLHEEKCKQPLEG